MKKHLYFIAVLIILSGLFSVYPVKYYMFSKPVKELPDFKTYKEAVSEDLPAKLYKKAGEHECGDYIIPVSQIRGDNQGFDYMADDINLAIQTYSGWKLSVDKELKQNMIKRAEKRFKTWGSMGIAQEMRKTAMLQKNVAMNTRYSAQAKCFELDNKKTDNLKVVVSVSDETTQSKLFEIPVFFTSPEIIDRLKNENTLKKKKYEDLKQRSKLSIYALLGLGSVFVFYLFWLTGLKFYQSKKMKRKKDWLLNEIEKREDLINEGHFVTALELSDDYLKYFPKDTDIKAFRQRLLDYTGNDPKKAQLAFVEWKKLQMRIDKPHSSGVYLSDEEKKNISPLIEYHPELKSSYLQLEQLDEQNRDAAFKEAENDYKKVLSLLKNQDLNEAKNLLENILSKNLNFKKAEELKQKLEKPALKSFKLKSLSTDLELIVFTKDKISFGRGDDNLKPDLVFTDRRISRNHASVEISSDKAVVKDFGSTAGTFVNGDRIENSDIKNNDLLTLAKVIDFDVLISDDSESGSLFLNGSDLKIVIIRDYASFNISEKGVRFLGNDLEIKLKDNMLILVSKRDVLIPDYNDEITISSTLFRIEEI